MTGHGLSFDHFGLATRDPERTLSVLRGLGYDAPPAIHDPLQGVNLVLCKHPAMPAVEVIYSDGNDGPLDAMLAQQPQSVYHLCFRSNDLTATLKSLKAEGQRVVTVSPPKPAVLFGGREVSFYMVRGFGLIEILEGAHE